MQRPEGQQAPSEPTNIDAGKQDVPAASPPPIEPRQRPQPQHRFSTLLTRFPGTWRNWRWLLVGVLLAGLLAAFLALRPAPPATPRRLSADTMSFPIGGQPTLIFTHSIGNVHITRGTDNQVLIKEKRNGFTDAIQVHYQQNGDSITTTADIQNGLMEDTWVDFDVSVPSQAGVIAISKNGGTLEADGLNGQITLGNTNGSIWATNLTGPVTLRTESGSINLKYVNGPMTLITQNGTITTSDVRAEGRSLVQAESGTINFHGSLDPQGNYLFKNGNGAVGLTLLPGTAFHVQAKTAGGAISSDFPAIKIQNNNGSSEAQGDVGVPPLAQLTVQTTSGQINLLRGVQPILIAANHGTLETRLKAAKRAADCTDRFGGG